MEEKDAKAQHSYMPPKLKDKQSVEPEYEKARSSSLSKKSDFNLTHTNISDWYGGNDSKNSCGGKNGCGGKE